MATVKELYDYIKLQIKLGKPINPFHQAIVDTYEIENTRTFKEISSSHIIKKRLNNNSSWALEYVPLLSDHGSLTD